MNFIIPNTQQKKSWAEPELITRTKVYLYSLLDFFLTDNFFQSVMKNTNSHSVETKEASPTTVYVLNSVLKWQAVSYKQRATLPGYLIT